MKFIRIKNYQSPTHPETVKFLNTRLEYIHHYWNFILLEKSRWIFFNHEKFESHRSLFTKINIQLTENIEWYPKRLRELTVNHPYFSDSNILVRTNASLQKRIAKFKSNVNTKVGAGKDHSSQHLKSLKQELSKIEKIILGKTDTDYFEKILDALIWIVHAPGNFNNSIREDIHFLVNAIIVELYHFGYTPAYIKRILDVVLFPREHVFDFPFSKQRSSFKSIEELNAYTTEELNSLTLRKQLLSLRELVTQPKRKGYYIFKIDNFNFSETEPITIWNVTFYNPALTKQLFYGPNAEQNEYAAEIEEYFEQFVEEKDKDTLRSTCNAIVATEYRPLNFNYTDQSTYQAIEKVNRSLSVLKNLKHLHVGGHSINAAVNLKSVIITHENRAYHAAPHILYDYNDEKAFELKDKAKESVKENLRWTNKLDTDNPFHKKVIDISFAINRYRYNPFSFSFRDFWITVADALFPNKPEKFFEFSYACVELYLKDQFMTNLKMFLHDSLRRLPISGYYSLTEKQVKTLGLDISIYKPIKAKKFCKQYPKITQFHDFEFIKEVIKDADSFTNDPDKYFSEIKKRMHTLIYEVYAERNLEVHNNLSTDLSLIKLREFCISLAVILKLVISQKINTRTRSVEGLKII